MPDTINDLGPLPVYEDIIGARERLLNHAVRTPLLESERLNKDTGARIFIKPEIMQKTGAFKFRGAYNRVAIIDGQTRKNGVVAYSSGNHGQAVALSAKMFDVPAVIVMPKDAPQLKIDSTRSHGAEIVFYDRQTDNRGAIAEAIALKRGLTLVRPYDDAQIIAGQGTIGLEVADDLDELGLVGDCLVAPAGGGGLLAGTALALSKRTPTMKVFAAEPSDFDDHRRSLAGGRRVSNAPAAPASLADALMAETPGEITFKMNRALLAGGYAATDADIGHAMRVLFAHFKLIAEPAGATALAAILSNRSDFEGKTVVAICSGGNVEADLFARILNKEI